MEEKIAKEFVSIVAALENIMNVGSSIGSLFIYDLDDPQEELDDNKPDLQEERRNKPADWEIEMAIQRAKAITASLAWDIQKTEYSQIDWQKIDVLTTCYKRFEAIYEKYTGKWKDGELDGLNEEMMKAANQLERYTALRNKYKNRLPLEADTERARKYFHRAVEAGYMKTTGTGYKWLFGGNRGKVRLAYFLEKVYCPNGQGQMPESALNRLFNVNRIGSARTQILDAKKPQRWRRQIDELFEESTQ